MSDRTCIHHNEAQRKASMIECAVCLLHERDALRAEVARLKAACEKEFASVEQLSDEVERLKADKARLDYCDTVIDLDQEHYVLRFPVRVSRTIRDAIDAAMKGAEANQLRREAPEQPNQSHD